MRPSEITEHNSFDGYNNWKNASKYLQWHEKGSTHRQAIFDLSVCRNKGQSVNSHLSDQIEDEATYWRTLLKYVVAIIKYLAERNLPFRGQDELIGSPHNGNFLGIIELMAQFDPFLQEHLRNYTKAGNGNTSYLSSTVCDEFIELIGTSLLDTIVCELKDCKFFSISLDSTPDVTKVDQLTLIVRYVLSTGQVEIF